MRGWLCIVYQCREHGQLCDFLKLFTNRFQVCHGARVIRILCTSMKMLCECLVEVILSYTTDCGVKIGGF